MKLHHPEAISSLQNSYKDQSQAVSETENSLAKRTFTHAIVFGRIIAVVLHAHHHVRDVIPAFNEQ